MFTKAVFYDIEANFIEAFFFFFEGKEGTLYSSLIVIVSSYIVSLAFCT